MPTNLMKLNYYVVGLNPDYLKICQCHSSNTKVLY